MVKLAISSVLLLQMLMPQILMKKGKMQKTPKTLKIPTTIKQFNEFQYFSSGDRTDIKTLFSGTCKDQIPEFSRTQQMHFQGL